MESYTDQSQKLLVLEIGKEGFNYTYWIVLVFVSFAVIIGLWSIPALSLLQKVIFSLILLFLSYLSVGYRAAHVIINDHDKEIYIVNDILSTLERTIDFEEIKHIKLGRTLRNNYYITIILKGKNKRDVHYLALSKTDMLELGSVLEERKIPVAYRL